MASIFTLRAIDTGILKQEMKPSILKKRIKEKKSTSGDGDCIIKWSTPIEGIEGSTTKYKNHIYNLTKHEGITLNEENLPVIRELRKKYKDKVSKDIDPTAKTPLKNLTLTITEAVEIYLKERYTDDKEYTRYLNAYNRIKNASLGSISFGDKWLFDLNFNDYQRVITYREKTGVKYATISRELSIVTSALNSHILLQYFDDNDTPYTPAVIDKKRLHYKSKAKGKNSLDMRIDTPLEEFSKSLYRAIMKQDNVETRLFHLLAFMTVRRVGEIQQLQVDEFDIDAKLIHCRAETTKTGREETYPISDEIIEAFKQHVNDYQLSPSDKVFHNLQRPYSDKFIALVQGLITDGTINVTKKFKNSYTQHDNRSLLGSVMQKRYSQTYIGKHVLSHYDDSSDGMYTLPTLGGKREILNDYWAVLRETKDGMTHPSNENNVMYTNIMYSNILSVD